MKRAVAMTTTCPVCRDTDARQFFEMRRMPVSIGVQWPSVEEARACKKGDLKLCFCQKCGFIWNHAFNPKQLEYSQRYDNSLDYSPVFQDYARKLAHRLIETYGIREKEVVELGCGKGHFLGLLCEQGNNRGIGFDPSFEGDRTQSPAADRITYVQDFYGPKYTDRPGDLVCCRHVFEHIPEPVEFLSMVRDTIGDRHSAIVYFEVPNVRFILEQLSIWDIIYEHCNYFSGESLQAVFRLCGFDVVHQEDAYRGQFLSLDARLSQGRRTEPVQEDVSKLKSAAERFSDQVRARSDTWEKQLEDLRSNGTRTAIWGGGAKAVSFLNMLKIRDAIPYVVDINPHKQGLHVPGTGQQIVSPEFLKEYRPQSVILMNPIYRQEVEDQLKQLGVTARILEA